METLTRETVGPPSFWIHDCLKKVLVLVVQEAEKMLNRRCGDQNLCRDFGWKTWLLLMEKCLVLNCTCVLWVTWRFHMSPGDFFRNLHPRLC